MASKKGYEVVRGHLRGPSKRTVQKAFSWYNIVPGIIKPIVSLLKFQQNQESWTPEFNLISMAYDEMKVSCLAELDQRLECLSGPSDQAFLLTIKGLVKDFQYPFFTAMDYTLSKDSYQEMIAELYKLDFTVLLTVKDQGSRNQGLVKELNVTPTSPYSPHPCDPTIKVYFAFDHLHSFKNLASHIRKKETKLPDGQIFTIDNFKKVLDTRGFFEISVGHHLKEKALVASGQESQRVKHAVNMLSDKTAELFESQDPNNQLSLAIAKFLRVCHNAHLVLTSNRWTQNEKKLHSPFGMFLDEQLSALNEYFWYMERLRFRDPINDKNFRKIQFQSAALLTISAIKMLQSDLASKFNQPQLLTHWTTQDYLELTFGIIRGLGGGFCLHPTTLQFRQRTEQQLICI